MSSAKKKKNQLLLACGVLFVLLASSFCSTVTAAADTIPGDSKDGFVRANTTDELLHKDGGRIKVDKATRDITVKLTDSDAAEGHKTYVKLHRINEQGEDLSYTIIRPSPFESECRASLQYDAGCGISAEWNKDKLLASTLEDETLARKVVTQKDVEVQHSSGVIMFGKEKAKLTTKCKLSASRELDFSIIASEGDEACEFAVQFSGEKYELEASTTTPAPATTREATTTEETTTVSEAIERSTNDGVPKDTKESGTGLTGGAIAGIAIGCLLCVALVVGGLIFCLICYKRNYSADDTTDLERGQGETVEVPVEVNCRSSPVGKNQIKASSSSAKAEKDNPSKKGVQHRRKPKKTSEKKPKQPSKPEKLNKLSPKMPKTPPITKEQRDQREKQFAERNLGQIDSSPDLEQAVRVRDQEPPVKDVSYIAVDLGPPPKTLFPKK